MEETKVFRYRTKISRTAKGVETPEFTVEGTGYTREEYLKELDEFTLDIKERYPLEIKEG